MGNAIDRLKISGFRRLADFELEMRPFTVLIGANSVGKTSFLDALSLLAASSSGNLNKTVFEYGGVANLLTRSRAKNISFVVDILVKKEEQCRYNLEITPNSSGYYISKETLSQGRSGDNNLINHINSANGSISYYDVKKGEAIYPDWEHSPSETSLAQAQKMFTYPNSVRNVLETVNRYHTLDVGIRAPVKLPQSMRPAKFPGENGEYLIPYLYYLREGYQDRYETIIDTLKVAFPDFENLNFPPVAAGMLTMTWSDRKFKEPISIHELSEGVLRFLWLVAYLYSPNLSAITMIDEPEVSLHPELLSILTDALREASMRTQLIVATHSDRLVRFLRPDEVAIMDIDENGEATATWADTLDLDAWLDEYGLDEVWRMGRMGGRA